MNIKNSKPIFEKIARFKDTSRLDVLTEPQAEEFLMENPEIHFEMALVESKLSALHFMRVDKTNIYPIGYSLDESEVYIFFNLDKFLKIK